jgi:acyl-coenzyme A thioesterase PaaI-like protein
MGVGELGGRWTREGRLNGAQATAQGWVYDEEENLVAMGTGAFRIFEKKGNPIV